MKKLLALLLILGMASMANAAISLTVAGADVGPEVLISDLEGARIGVSSTEGGSSPLGYVIVEEGGAGVLADGVVVAAAGDPALAYTVPYTEAGWGAGFEWAAANTPTVAVTPGEWFNYALNGAAVGDVVSLFVDPEYGTPADTFTVIIPEPLTLSLLGLGGLALLRRRHA